MRNSWIPAIAALAVVCAGCGGSDNKNEAAATAAKNEVDACGLLTDADVTTAIGQHGPGNQVSADKSAPVCQWTGAAGAVMLTIGVPDTAPGGKLPSASNGLPVTPGPDGMQFVMPGTAQFSAGSRLNFVNVAKGKLPEGELNNIAATLARAVTTKLGK